MNIGVLFMLGVSSLGVLGVIMAGWASNSNYSLMGSLRSGAQMVSYEIAMGMAVVSAVMLTSRNGARNHEHDRDRAGAAGAAHLVRLSFFPARTDCAGGLRHRNGGAKPTAPPSICRKRKANWSPAS